MRNSISLVLTPVYKLAEFPYEIVRSVDTFFTFKNTGDQPLIISNAKGSCGCTVPQWPKEPIEPGNSGTINVKFNSKNKSGKQNKRVTLTMNTTPNTMQLRVLGEITVPQK